MKANITTNLSQTSQRSLRQTHRLLAVQSLVVVLVSINRLSSLTTGYVAANEFLRWVDLNNMLILPLISLLAFYLLKKQLEVDGSARNRKRHLALNLAFLIGVYLLAASYGDHEVTNYLHGRFCPGSNNSSLCRIIIFNDDEFSHWIFFSGFVFLNASLMLMQILFLWSGRLTRRDLGWLVLNGLFIGAGIFANLAFEEIGLDLYIVALLALLALALLWRYGRQPLLIYYSSAYCVGLIATAVYKGLVLG